jgi:hypothetical protein
MTDTVNNNPDCLVLKLEEVENDTNNLDTTLYILYDKMRHVYVVRGRRRWTPKIRSCTYSFECDFAKDLADFIQYTICPYNKVNETLLNYDNLPSNVNDITYEFLHDYDHSDYEIAGYNDIKIKRSKLLKRLRMLRNVYNYY